MPTVKVFREEFFSEAMEHVDNLNKYLLALEDSPGDEDVINDIFRSAHTLKGNANTMGFTKFGNLAHALEDLLANIRDKKVEATSELMDILFETCDKLEDGLELLEKDNSENDFETSSVLVKLNKYVKRDQNPNENHSVPEHIKLDEADWDRINQTKDKNTFRVIGAFDSTCKIKFAKALLLLRELSNNSEIVKSSPSEDDIKTGKLGSGVEFLIITDKSKEDIGSILAYLTGFDHIDLLGIDAKYEKKKLNKIEHENKERAKHKITEKNKNEAIKQVQSVKISIERLDHLMNLVGELLINNMRIKNIATSVHSKELSEIIQSFDRLVGEIQEEVMSERMIPIGAIFNRFPRMIRDLSKKENKKVNIIIEGEEIEFDRTVLDEIGDPLVHILRNSVDHGIESIEERNKADKPETGTISLIATRKKNAAVIEISDDGTGIDPIKVKNSAIKKGLLTAEEADSMTTHDLQKLIFRPGLSTNEVVTEVSGRGVGMDVVETKVRQLGGNVKVLSEKGKGTKILLELPLTLAIVNALLVEVGKETYAIQLSQVDRVVRVPTDDIKTIQGNASVVLMGNDIPLVDLAHELQCRDVKYDKMMTVVVVEKEMSKVGFIVQNIIAQQQILIKPLDNLVKGTKGIAGAMILGGGDIGLILDVGAFT